MEYWMSGVLKNIAAHSLHKSSKAAGVCAAFLMLKNLTLNFRPLLQYSITPLTPGSEGMLWPPFRGLHTKPYPLGVDSLFDREGPGKGDQ
jgi:hypothetical protein